MNLDYQLFELINQFAGKSHFLDQLVILFSKYGPILFGLVFVWLWFSKKGDPYENKQIVLLAVTIVFMTLGLAKLMELAYFRPRPFVSHSVNLLSDKSSGDPHFQATTQPGHSLLHSRCFGEEGKPERSYWSSHCSWRFLDSS